MPAASILIADDQPHIVEALRLLLKAEAFHVDAVHSPRDVLAALDTAAYDVALIDLNYARDTTSGGEGLDLITGMRRRDRSLPIVVMTAWSSVSVAVEAMQRGAADFVAKPWDNRSLVSALHRHILT